jgi:hypothetical protein
MSTRICAASMAFLVTLQFSGSPKVPWSQRSENTLLCCLPGHISFIAINLMLNLLLCRYEGQRTVETLVEFINTEAGRL